jgi:acetoin utilization protein AcuB
MSARVVTVGMDDTVQSVTRLFEHHGFHHAVVLDDDRKMIGVISDRDLLRATSPFVAKLAERPIDVQTLARPIHQLMSRRPITAKEDETVATAAHRMLELSCSCLPIVDQLGELVGILTTRDILRLTAQSEHHVNFRSSHQQPSRRPSIPPSLRSSHLPPGR